MFQKNSKRMQLRRKPEEILSVRMPFDSSKFNFTKIKEEEYLFDLSSTDYKDVSLTKSGTKSLNFKSA